MNNARNFLNAFFAEAPGCTQAEFARASGMTAANLSDLLAGHVAISYRNMSRLLNGFKAKNDRLRFLIAHLHDETPPGYENDIVIKAKPLQAAKFQSGEEELLEAWQRLSGPGLQKRIIRLLKVLPEDEDIRVLFAGAMDYVERGLTGIADKGRTKGRKSRQRRAA